MMLPGGPRSREILAAGDPTKSRIERDNAEIDMVFLQCDDATTRPTLTCEGLVCIPVPDYVNVLNPTTGEFLSFPSGPIHHHDHEIVPKRPWFIKFPGCWAMGFGRDKFNGSYKVARMLFDDNRFEILDVNIGQWRKLRPPPYQIDAERKSASVNGSIYWLKLRREYKILALDLHTQEFHDVPVLPPHRYTSASQIVNLEDRLAVVDTCFHPEWKLEIWIMDAQEENWTMTYNISLSPRLVVQLYPATRWFIPVAVSKQGNLFFYDNEKNLFIYYPEIDSFDCLSSNIFVISPFVENLVSLRLHQGCGVGVMTYGYGHGLRYLDQVPGSCISTIARRIESRIPDILLTSTLASLIIFGYYKYRS
ncbi:unnamed protein product [Arabis nemorensis]|uniref:F-box associated beta-propeller type 1 domain-containing protein n=1 Tax=Arabis nemorensis TaxID=586526 RepID=A0A565C802_9BRAS|nr:unnamed protein product [Arabis nemorensis]